MLEAGVQDVALRNRHLVFRYCSRVSRDLQRWQLCARQELAHAMVPSALMPTPSSATLMRPSMTIPKANSSLSDSCAIFPLISAGGEFDISGNLRPVT